MKFHQMCSKLRLADEVWAMPYYTISCRAIPKSSMLFYVDTYRFLSRCIRPFKNHRHKFVTLHQFRPSNIQPHGWPLQWNCPAADDHRSPELYGYRCHLLIWFRQSELCWYHAYVRLCFAAKRSTDFNWPVCSNRKHQFFVQIDNKSIDYALCGQADMHAYMQSD